MSTQYEIRYADAEQMFVKAADDEGAATAFAEVVYREDGECPDGPIRVRQVGHAQWLVFRVTMEVRPVFTAEQETSR